MDKKIRAAAENDIHGYEDKSWQNMEVLLDKHLPQKKRRRGVIIFFLIASLAVSGYLLVSTMSSSNKETLSQQKNSTPSTSGSEDNQNTNSVITTVSDNNKDAISNEKISAEGNTQHTEQIAAPYKPAGNNPSSDKDLFATAKKSIAGTLMNTEEISQQSTATRSKKTYGSVTRTTEPVVDNPVNTAPAETPLNFPATPDKQKSIAASPLTITDKPATNQPVTAAADKKEDTDPAEPISNDPAKKEQKLKSRTSKFSFTFSFGPDLTSIGIHNPGRVKTQFGVGVGYEISDKFRVRTGFYAGRKIYSADSGSYHTPYNSGLYSFKLHSIDANCFVYEIPVSVVYNFAKAKNHSWFASAGLSSYIMKDESYVYTYKNPTGQQMNYAYDYRNENSHFLSVLNLSGGYQYNINKRFSLMAEPYIKLPLSGIGEGRVRLNSAGILFTASLKPFGK